MQDPSLPAPFVPASVFTVVSTGVGYWSATTDATFPDAVWVVDFLGGAVEITDKTNNGHAWCVRGPMQESMY